LGPRGKPELKKKGRGRDWEGTNVKTAGKNNQNEKGKKGGERCPKTVECEKGGKNLKWKVKTLGGELFNREASQENQINLQRSTKSVCVR